MKNNGKAGIAGLTGAAAIAAAFLMPWEGRALRAYPDVAGIWTICDGDTRDVRPGQVATPEECDSRTARAVMEHAAGLDRCLKAKLPDKTRAALISWAYNVGVGAACKSTLVRLANAGDLVGACNQLPRWNRAGGREVRGLTNRRAAERVLCLEGLAQ